MRTLLLILLLIAIVLILVGCVIAVLTWYQSQKGRLVGVKQGSKEARKQEVSNCG
jgi:flagellar basal body-associated protein FliL